jgi:hypothetical protein
MEQINNNQISNEVARENINKLDVAMKCPLHFDFSGNMKSADGYHAIYNLSRDKYCASVSDEYTIIQHRNFFNSILDSLDNKNIPYKAKVSAHKNRAFMDIEFTNRANIKFDKLGEEFGTGIRLVNSYDRTTGVKIMAKLTRLACLNGMVISKFSDVINCKHNSKALDNFGEFVENGLNGIFSQSQKLEGWVSECMTDSADWKVALKVVSALFKERKHRKAILSRLGIDMTTTGKKGQLKDNYSIADELSKKSRWEIYNAITNYLTYDEKLRISQESLFQKLGERVLTTPIEKLPQIEVFSQIDDTPQVEVVTP